jgi:hypothetical protein
VPPNAGRENSLRDLNDSPAFSYFPFEINVERRASHNHAVGFEDRFNPSFCLVV